MILAGVGWAAYTICGKAAANPLASTAANFCICLPILCVILFPWMSSASVTGFVLAAICGSATSGLGYALWYRVLPGLQQSTAAVVQLSVPIIAIVAGTVLLGEVLTSDVVIAAVLVIAGIGWAVTSQSALKHRS
jgi:drug/metabolite transporter (DMT)-like permease